MEQQQVQVQVQSPPLALKCPRCDSSNTKFCYYNNYSLSQPRHLCKACKRYWTRGGSLRNVPVGGGCRKNKTKVIKSSSSLSSLAKPSSTAVVQSSTNTHTISSTNLNPCYSIRTTGNYDIMSLPQFNSGGVLRFSTDEDFVTSQNLSSSYPNFGQLQNMVSSGLKDIITPQSTIPYGFLGLEDDVQILLKMEGHGNTTTTNYDHNYIEEDHEINLPFMWNSSSSTSTTGGGVWHDSSNIGSSVPSL